MYVKTTSAIILATVSMRDLLNFFGGLVFLGFILGWLNFFILFSGISFLVLFSVFFATSSE